MSQRIYLQSNETQKVYNNKNNRGVLRIPLPPNKLPNIEIFCFVYFINFLENRETSMSLPAGPARKLLATRQSPHFVLI